MWWRIDVSIDCTFYQHLQRHYTTESFQLKSLWVLLLIGNHHLSATASPARSSVSICLQLFYANPSLQSNSSWVLAGLMPCIIMTAMVTWRWPRRTLPIATIKSHEGPQGGPWWPAQPRVTGLGQWQTVRYKACEPQRMPRVVRLTCDSARPSDRAHLRSGVILCPSGRSTVV